MMLQVLIDQKGGTVENEIRGGILHQKNVRFGRSPKRTNAMSAIGQKEI
jgi:hypothetical protein